MSINRFKFFIRAIRFDNYRDRAARLQNNHLDQIGVQVCEDFMFSEDTLTVDEQFVDYRGTMPGRTYIPSKSRKYDVKIFWLCEENSVVLTEAQHRSVGGCKVCS